MQQVTKRYGKDLSETIAIMLQKNHKTRPDWLALARRLKIEGSGKKFTGPVHDPHTHDANRPEGIHSYDTTENVLPMQRSNQRNSETYVPYVEKTPVVQHVQPVQTVRTSQPVQQVYTQP